jgi:hypothetical protein
MKRLILALGLLTLFSCNNGASKGAGIDTDAISNSESADGKTDIDISEMTFEEDVFDFGKIIQGEKVSHAFNFKNTGKKSLIISNASGSCGCTVPDWPREPVQPGQSGKINVVFSSEGKSGLQEKTVTIVTNSEPATKVIRIKADIIVAETAK